MQYLKEGKLQTNVLLVQSQNIRGGYYYSPLFIDKKAYKLLLR